MYRAFIAPAAYVQGPDLLAETDDIYSHLQGTEAYVLGGTTALELVEGRLRKGLESAGIGVTAVKNGVSGCTWPIIERHVDAVTTAAADIVIGVGGGVAMDVATAVADQSDAELVAVPTIASTDAPTSTVSVIYDEHGNFIEVLLRERNPELVVVDSRVIAAAPSNFLAHGMGDAIATRFEAEAAMVSGAEVKSGGQANRTALELARLAYERVEEYGTAALRACDRDAVTPALSHVIEANTLLSGLGFESSGTAGAHAIQIGLTNVGVREPHGVLVGFGTIGELILQDRSPAEIEAVCDLERAIGIDRTLADFGVDDEAVDRAGEIAMDHGMTAEAATVTSERVADAIRTADTYLRE